MLNDGGGFSCGSGCFCKNDVLNKRQRSLSLSVVSDENLYAKYCRFDSVEYVSDTIIYMEMLTGPVEYNGAFYEDTETVRTGNRLTGKSYEISNTCSPPINTSKECLSAGIVLGKNTTRKKYQLLEGGAYCKNFFSPDGPLYAGYGIPLDASDPLASSDFAEECSNRCSAKGYNYFFIKYDMKYLGCMCGHDLCATNRGQAEPFNTYSIVPGNCHVADNPDANVCPVVTSYEISSTCVDKEAFGRRDGFLNEHVPYEAGSSSECVVECALRGFAHTLYTTYEKTEGTYFDQECNFGLGCNVVQAASTESMCWCYEHDTQQACEDAGRDWIPIDADYSANPDSSLNPPGRGLRVFNDIHGNPLISISWLTLEVPQLLRVTDVVCYSDDVCPPL